MSKRSTAETRSHPFTPQEVARLTAYRAAVSAGFYTDAAPDPLPSHPFTSRELRRLVAYKAAVTAGFFSEGLAA